MHCSGIRELISAYIDDQLGPDEKETFCLPHPELFRTAERHWKRSSLSMNYSPPPKDFPRLMVSLPGSWRVWKPKSLPGGGPFLPSGL